jgi:uncharacterized membrane-anchored protein
MSISSFVLGLFVFLQSSALLGWFSVDNKLVGAVGIVFVAILVLEAIRGPLVAPFGRRV